MPSNMVQINGSEVLTWEVPDSRMDMLIGILNVVGSRANDDCSFSNRAAAKIVDLLPTELIGDEIDEFVSKAANIIGSELIR